MKNWWYANILAQVTFFERTVDYFRPFVEEWGYITVFVFSLLEHSFMIGLAVPGDMVLLMGALYAGMGELNIFWVAALAFIGSVLGDNLGYLIGRKLGRPLIDRYGHVFKLKARVIFVERYFKKYGGATVFIARFASFVGTLASPVAGMSRMDYKQYFIYESLGSLVWAILYGLLGFFFGSNIELIEQVFRYVGNFLFGLFIAVCLGAYIYHRVKAARKHSRELGEVMDEELDFEEDLCEANPVVDRFRMVKGKDRDT
ncbi:MAG: DedA family protein [Actinobacteria bacterium]|nr:DedA family protein [Actinomycetota bacterium]